MAKAEANAAELRVQLERLKKETAEVMAKAKKETADNKCTVCLQQGRTHAFMHVESGDGHLAVCADCAEALYANRTVARCTVCRQTYSAVWRIYQ